MAVEIHHYCTDPMARLRKWNILICRAWLTYLELLLLVRRLVASCVLLVYEETQVADRIGFQEKTCGAMDCGLVLLVLGSRLVRSGW